jgi:enoyl-[acyl-carrier-protein] reductase (NADH)
VHARQAAPVTGLARAEAVRCDVTDDESLVSLTQRIESAGQLVGAVVHAAVKAIRAPLIGSADSLLGAIDVSAVSLVRAVTALDGLLKNGRTLYAQSEGKGRPGHWG